MLAFDQAMRLSLADDALGRGASTGAVIGRDCTMNSAPL